MQAFKDYLALEPVDADAVELIADELEPKLHPEHLAAESAATNLLSGVSTNATLNPPVIATRTLSHTHVTRGHSKSVDDTIV